MIGFEPPPQLNEFNWAWRRWIYGFYKTLDVQPSWIDATLLNSWANTAGYNNAGYFKDSLGRVHLRGMIDTGTLNTVAFTLPAGYRPDDVLVFPTSANNAFGNCFIQTDGDVLPTNGSNTLFSLEGISF